jgi:hypothetical protein
MWKTAGGRCLAFARHVDIPARYLCKLNRSWNTRNRRNQKRARFFLADRIAKVRVNVFESAFEWPWTIQKREVRECSRGTARKLQMRGFVGMTFDCVCVSVDEKSCTKQYTAIDSKFAGGGRGPSAGFALIAVFLFFWPLDPHCRPASPRRASSFLADASGYNCSGAIEDSCLSMGPQLQGCHPNAESGNWLQCDGLH